MSGRRCVGPVLAGTTSIPVWVILVLDPPPLVWFNLAVALLHLGFAAVVGTWVMNDPRGRLWLRGRGATATWAGLGGLGAAPAVILHVDVVLALLALAGLAVMLTVLSPVLSGRVEEMLERVLAPEPEVRPIPKLGELPPPAPASQLIRMVPPPDAHPA